MNVRLLVVPNASGEREDQAAVKGARGKRRGFELDALARGLKISV